MSEDTKPLEDSGSVASHCSPCRERFEAWVSDDPYARSVERCPDDPEKFAWPGTYKDINTELAWQAWQTAWELGEPGLTRVRAIEGKDRVGREIHVQIPAREADARLVAAAPEMLEALRKCLSDYCEPSEIMHGRCFSTGNIVRDAIEKATGVRPDEVV